MNDVIFTVLIVAGIVCLVFIALVSLLIYLLVKEKDQHIVDLQDELDNLLSRKRVRQTGPTLAGIEDISAALTRIKHERRYEDELLDASLRTLGQIRQGPYEYDPDTKCVQREVERRR